jgi:hypothetical protein
MAKTKDGKNKPAKPATPPVQKPPKPDKGSKKDTGNPNKKKQPTNG